MTNKQLIAEWRSKHPQSHYYVPEGATCDRCGNSLTDAERWKNITENEEQDGNATLCAKHNQSE